MFQQLLIEIENMPVRIALPQYRHKTKDVALHPERFTIGFNHALRSKLGGSVQRGLYRKRAVLRRWEDVRFPVNGAGGGKRDSLHTALTHGVQHIPGHDDVLFQISVGMIRTESDIGVGSQMKDDVHALDGPS